MNLTRAIAALKTEQSNSINVLVGAVSCKMPTSRGFCVRT